MLDGIDINLIRERLEYEEAFFSQLDELEDMDFPSDFTVDENGNPDYHENEIFCYRDDECWCDEYEPEYDPFDSLDYLPYEF